MEDGIDIEWTHLEEVLRQYGERLVALYRENMERSGRPASGDLAQSLHTEVVAGDTTIGVDLSLLEYWKYIEHGTSPHWAPIEPLRRWVEVKRMLPRPMANGKLPTPNQLAHMVQWKIAREGTEGKDDLSRALQQTWDEFGQAVADAVTLDISHEIDYVLSYLLVA